MTLQELIAESRQIIAARRAQEEAERLQREQEYDARFSQVMTDLVARINTTLPDPLRPFVAYAGLPVSIETLNTYPDAWTPCDFKVSAALLLVDILFTTTTAVRAGILRVSEIRISDVSFGTDWAEAISAAAGS